LLFEQTVAMELSIFIKAIVIFWAFPDFYFISDVRLR